MTPLLKLHDLSRSYGEADARTVALRDVSIEIAAGEFVAVMGPSGCGKSTLLNIMGMLDRPDAGRFEYAGTDVFAQSEKQRSRLRRAHIGFVFQNENLIDELSIEENIELALLYQAVPARRRRSLVARVMDRVGIAHRARHRPGQLSGGQQQRAAVARAVVGQRAVILADEPTGSLDSGQGTEVMELLREVNHAGTTVVMVTHSLAHADYARRTIRLFDGRVDGGASF